MSQIIHFYDNNSITISDEQAEAIHRAIDGGVEWIKFTGKGSNIERYKVSDIRRIVEAYDTSAKDYRTLGLPELVIPDDLKEAYARRTISLDETKRLSE